MKLTLSGIYKTLIEFEPNYLRLPSTKGKDSGETVTFKTDKKGFTIQSVTFNENNNTIDFKSNIPLRFSLEKAAPPNVQRDTATTKQPQTVPSEPPAYLVKIYFTPFEKKDAYGDFIFKTNLPEKPEIKIPGQLDGKKE